MYQVPKQVVPQKRLKTYLRDREWMRIGMSTGRAHSFFVQFHKPHLSDLSVDLYTMVTPITTGELSQAFRSLKNNRALGVDHVTAEY